MGGRRKECGSCCIYIAKPLKTAGGNGTISLSQYLSHSRFSEMDGMVKLEQDIRRPKCSPPFDS